MNKFKTMYAVILAITGVLLGAPASAQDVAYPDRPVRIIVPFTPGGAVDVVARIAAESLTHELGQNFIVENKPGAGGAIGVSFVARAPADGYTLLLGSIGPMTINPSLQDNLPYSVSRDFEPIIRLAATSLVLVTQPQSGAQTVPDLVSRLKAKPGHMTYGSAGVGNITHMAAAYFLSRTSTTATHVPYQGSAPAITDFLGGRLDFMFDVVPSAQPYIKSGQYHTLAVTSAHRTESLPDIPTLQELGFDGFDVSSWFGIFAPANTPLAIVTKLNHALNRALQSAEVRSQLRKIGADPVGGSEREFADFVRDETIRWHDVVMSTGAKGS